MARSYSYPDFANVVADSIYPGDGGTWLAIEQNQLMGTGGYQAYGLNDAVVLSAAQTSTTRSSQPNQPSDPTGGPNNGLDQSSSTERGGATSDRRLADIVSRVPSGEGAGAQRINWLPGNHGEEPVAEEANGSSVHRVERAWQSCEMSYLDRANGGNCRPYGTAAREALPFPVQEDVTHLPVQEQCGVLPDEPNLVSSVGNAEKPTVHRCSTEELRQWKQQHTRSKPQEARKKKNACNPSFIFKITEVAQHRENETPIFTDAVYNDHQEKLVGIRIHPKGVGGGTGRHVALFIHLIKGDFDNSLDWPFAGIVSISVLDQSDSSPRRDLIHIIQANPDVPAFQQPGETICRIGYGYERFAPIEEFFGPRYVKDDALLLKIEFSG
ncbi:TNF receptor-associated factor 6-A-like isoform X2 [Montipora foliosa]|uniref:TNF receptor-associated factor 6-A-like isoform X2 n=1 Tax=Montipora foliosa TaxID=591990 RepID=UPI0035F15046